MVPRVVLDTGAVIALSRGDVRVRQVLREALAQGSSIIVPPVVVTQTIRGGTGDARILQILRFAFVSFVGQRLARSAGQLLGACGLTDAADALIMAEALRATPSVVLTSDPEDMRALAGGRPDVHVFAV